MAKIFYILFLFLVTVHFAIFLSISLLSKKQRALPISNEIQKNPSICICIPAADESIELIKNNIEAIKKNISYQNIEIFLLENSKNKKNITDIINICKALNVNIYNIDNMGNKAKALNNFIQKKLNTDYLMVVDVDQILQKDVIKDILPFFNKEIVLIQTAQDFSNKEKNFLTSLYCNMQYIFGRLCHGFNFVGYGLCLGSNFIANVDFLRQIGGFDESSIVEDIATSYKITTNKKKIVFINKAFFKGIAPDNIKSYFIQTERYFFGNLKLLFFVFRNILKDRKNFKVDIFYIFFNSSYIISIIAFIVNVIAIINKGLFIVILLNTLIIIVNILFVYSEKKTYFLGGWFLFILSSPLYIFFLVKFIFLHKKITYKVTPK